MTKNNLDLAHWQAAAGGARARSTACPARSSASCAGRARRAPRTAYAATADYTRDRPAGHAGLGVPDRLDLQGLDRDRRHAAGRRGQGRPRHPGRRDHPGARSSRDPDVTKQVTIWHLLTHTSGIDGDVFTDTGRGDDDLEKYVALLARRRAEPPARRHLVVLQLGLVACWAGSSRCSPARPGTRR